MYIRAEVSFKYEGHLVEISITLELLPKTRVYAFRST